MDWSLVWMQRLKRSFEKSTIKMTTLILIETDKRQGGAACLFTDLGCKTFDVTCVEGSL